MFPANIGIHSGHGLDLAQLNVHLNETGTAMGFNGAEAITND